MCSVIPSITISLLALLAVEAKLARMDLHVSLQFTSISEKLFACWALHLPTDHYNLNCVVLPWGMDSLLHKCLKLEE